MLAHTKMLPTKHEPICKVILEMPGKKKRLSFVPKKHLHKLEAFLEKYGESDTILWEELAAKRITKYGRGGLVLRGARYREGLSQKELAKRSGVSQENISKMENGQRAIGIQVAKKLAKVLHIKPQLLAETAAC
jgi:DNA-binding XRE family transcriptional regulator